MPARALALGALLIAGAGTSLAVPPPQGSDSVEVSLVIAVSRNLSLDLDGTVSATSPHRVSFEGEAAEALAGFTTGCLFMRGVDRVDLTLEGGNPYLNTSGPGPFLAGSGPAAGIFLYYEPVIAIGPPGANFAGRLFDAHAQPSSSEVILSLADRPTPDQRVNRVTVDRLVFAASGGSTSDAACSAGDNFAVGALVFITDSARSALPAGLAEDYYSSLEQLTGGSGLAEGEYRFSDGLTVTIVPRFD
jgi:hypothetical protein